MTLLKRNLRDYMMMNKSNYSYPQRLNFVHVDTELENSPRPPNSVGCVDYHPVCSRIIHVI